MSDTLLFRVEDGLGWLTLKRPRAKNAIDDELREAMLATLVSIAADADIRAVVLTAAGDSFCPGADLFRRQARPHRGRPSRHAARHDEAQLAAAHPRRARPGEARDRGRERRCAGMGAHLAFACDLVIAATEARFIEVFVRRGLAVDAGGAYLLSPHARHPPREGAGHARRRARRAGCAAPRSGQQGRAAGRARRSRARVGRTAATGPTFALGSPSAS